MDILQAVEHLRVWESGGQRAPHKPLLLLLVLGKYIAGHPRNISFSEVNEPLEKLLIDFGPPRKQVHPEYPFWHLGSDGIWELKNMDIPRAGIGSISPSKTDLLSYNAQGGLTDECFQQVMKPDLFRKVVTVILESSFPATIYEDILAAVGIPIEEGKLVGKRDATFRDNVLRAYQNECAICGFSARMGNVLAGVEAAHIKWHQAGGPDTYPNGIALCSLHHKLFDLGMITISADYRILVSEHATGTAIFVHLVTDFQDQQIRLPIRTSYQPSDDFLDWHLNQVFRAPFRESKSVDGKIGVP